MSRAPCCSLVLGWVLASACGPGATLTADEATGSSEGECPIGSEGCRCTSGGSCDPGLTCLSGLCVDAGRETDGGSTSGGATSADSNGSSTGAEASDSTTSTGSGPSTSVTTSTTVGDSTAATTDSMTDSTDPGTSGADSSTGAITSTSSTDPTTSTTSGSQGCSKIDMLFVIDNSASMQEEQQSLVNSFPNFVAAIENTLMIQDHHIMVVDTDTAASGGSAFMCTPDPSCCTNFCSMNPTGTCNNNPCSSGPAGCDFELGAGKTKDANGNDCGITGGNRYIVEGQTNLSSTFSCIAVVGTSGDGNERPMQAMVEAVTTQNGMGMCNDGFLRSDALLAVTFVTDEEDVGKSTGDPATWKQALVAAKNGNENAVVVLGILGDIGTQGSVCTRGAAEDAPVLRTFVDSLAFGTWGSVCASDYTPFFDQAVSLIQAACDQSQP